MKQYSFLAFDLGATSGRTILGTLNEGKLQMKELTRFPNQILELGGHFYWNIYSLYEHLKAGMVAAAKEDVEIESIGIDTWGVDFAFLGSDGQMLGMPYAYRDPHTMGAPEEYFEKIMSRKEVYEATGIQVMNFNSLYQLYAMKRDKSSLLAAAKEALFIPDALSYMLTGKKVVEYTIASTSQMLNPRTKKFEKELLEKMGVDPELFGQIVMPGYVIGELTDTLAAETGLGKIPVVAVAGHDTASAVAAVPAKNEKFAYLSSGTWSLMGIEVKDAIINKDSYEKNFTNEGGVEGTTRFLKNICGMWLLERCRKEWEATANYSYTELIDAALAVPAFRSVINPDAPCFANPDSMIQAIRMYCEKTGQPVPETYGEITRCIFDSLALRYRQVFGYMQEMAPYAIERLHVIGGGSRNNLLNQFTCNAVGVPVTAGPSEGTALGNIMLQAKAFGLVDSIQEMRDMIASSIELVDFEPKDADVWKAAYEKYLTCYREDI